MTEEQRQKFLALANDPSTFIKTTPIKKVKPKKTQAEKIKEELDRMSNIPEEKPIEQTVLEKEWDVPKDQPIEYFDPDLSYELTGYRPITSTKGLDFKASDFNKAALNFLIYGKYTNFIPKTLPHRQYWEEEFRRCLNGYTVGKYTITGYNYFYLNYYRLLTSILKEGVDLRQETFPAFINKLYEYFHYIELCKKSGHDCLAFKGRGVGASEIAAAIAACEYTFHKTSRSVITACLESQVTRTLSKVWNALDFLDGNTELAFRRVRMKIDTAFHKRASKVTSDGIEEGWKSEIQGITADKAKKLRGDRCDLIFFEEAGTAPHLIDTYIESEALISVGGVRVGTRAVFGCVCAGTKVYKNDGTICNIEDLKQEDGILGWGIGGVSKEPITYMLESKVKPCVKIATAKGTLECSTDHPILVRETHHPRDPKNYNKRLTSHSYKFVEAGLLHKYVNIDPKRGHKAHICMADEIDIWGNVHNKHARMIGMLIGGGSYTYKNTPKLSNCDADIWRWVEERYETSGNKGYITKDGRHYKERRIKNFIPILKECGIYGQAKDKKLLPQNIDKWDKLSTIELIAGLFDTDGYINIKNHHIDINQSSKELLVLLKFLLRKLGIWSSSIMKIPPSIAPNRKDKNAYYRLCISDKRSVYNFAKLIPLLINYKLAALDSFDYIPSCTQGMRYTTIKSVESIGMQPIYNLCANTTHTYIANDIITHNTSDSSGASLAGLKSMFYHPDEYCILPYKNPFMRDGKVDFTGYFIPSFSVYYGAGQGDDFELRGVVNECVAKNYYKNRFDTIKDPRNLIRTKAEYCFTPEDGFILEGENRFNQENLVNQMSLLENTTMILKPENVRLFWSIKDGVSNRDAEPLFEVSPLGKILIAEMPIRDQETKLAVKNLYVIGCLTPGEKVLTTEGLKKCEDVTLDDKLFSIKGEEVNIINLQLYYKENEDIYKVKLNNIFSTTTFTGEHPIYCAANINDEFDFKLVKDIKPGYYVKVPNIYKKEKQLNIDKFNSEEFWYNAGFALNLLIKNEDINTKLFDFLFLDKINGVQDLRNIFYDNEFFIPEWIKYLPTLLKKCFIYGLLESNNHMYASLRILEDILDILFSLGILSKITSHKDTYLLQLVFSHDSCFFSDKSHDYIYIKIESIEKDKYTGIVYNYHCETSTFMCHYIPTHNCDSIDADASTSTGLTDVSQFCIVVYKRNFGLLPPKIVALYKDRPRDIKEAYDNAMKLARFYNCKICLEATRVGIVAYFRTHHKDHYFMKRPLATYLGLIKRVNLHLIGFPTTPDIINHALELIEGYINDYSDQIVFKEILDEAIRYSYANKRKFDIIAAWGAAMLGAEDMNLYGKVGSGHTSTKKEFREFGWYTDSNGIRQFGYINLNNTNGELERYY